LLSMLVTVRLALAAVLVVAVGSFPIGRSLQGRPITAIRVGDPHGTRRLLVVGCIHGNECAGTAITTALEHTRTRADLWIIPDLNPDGYAHGTRQNARGVDLNANWSSGWQPEGGLGTSPIPALTHSPSRRHGSPGT
jgi:murein peptide amidase A